MNNFLPLILFASMLGLTIFLIIAANQSQRKSDTKFGKFSQKLDKVLSDIFTEIRDMISKPDITKK